MMLPLSTTVRCACRQLHLAPSQNMAGLPTRSFCVYGANDNNILTAPPSQTKDAQGVVLWLDTPQTAGYVNIKL